MRAQIPLDRHDLQGGFGTPEAVRHDRDAMGYLHRCFDTWHALDRVKIVALECTAKDRAGQHRGIEHVRQADIDAKGGGAVHFRWDVKAFLGLAEQGKLRGLFDAPVQRQA